MLKRGGNLLFLDFPLFTAIDHVDTLHVNFIAFANERMFFFMLDSDLPTRTVLLFFHLINKLLHTLVRLQKLLLLPLGLVLGVWLH